MVARCINDGDTLMSCPIHCPIKSCFLGFFVFFHTTGSLAAWFINVLDISVITDSDIVSESNMTLGLDKDDAFLKYFFLHLFLNG